MMDVTRGTGRRVFTVTAQRGTGDVWVLECAEVGAVSQTESLSGAAEEMREAIAYQAGIDADEVDILVEILEGPRMETEREAYERFDELARKTVEGASGLMERLKAFDEGGPGSAGSGVGGASG
jgi:hypothetical protein